MRRPLIALAALLLCGCSETTGVSTSPAADRTNAVRILNSSANLRVGNDPVNVVTLTGHDAAGNQVFGPFSEPYDEDMTFPNLPTETRKVKLAFQRGEGYPLSSLEENVDFVNDDDGQVFLSPRQSLPPAAPRNTFTVRVVNNSDYPDDQVFVAVNGKNRQQTGFYFLNFAQNAMQPFGGTNRWAEYSQQLSLLTKEAGAHAYSFQCPYDALVSGRIYLSFGKKLQGLGLNNVNDPLSLQLPSPSGAPDYQTLFEFMELSATIPDDPQAPQIYTLFANTSVVDFFSIGLGMTLEYYNGAQNTSETVGFVDGSRDKILADFAAAPGPFQEYIRKDGSNNVLRVLSPVQTVSIKPAGTLSQFLAPAIDAAWTFYSQTALNIPDTIPSHTYGYRWTGLPIANGILAMTCTAKPAGDNGTGDLESLNEVCRLPKPTTRIVFFCDDDQNPPPPVRNTYRNDGSKGHKRLVSLISAALNRGVFETYADWGSGPKFYTRADHLYNHYAKIMHRFALNGKVYGFGYDDVYGQDPTLARTLTDVNQVVITIPRVSQL